MNLSMSLVKVNYALIMNYHWYKTSLLPQAVLCDVQRFYYQKSVQLRDQFCILTKMKNSVWYCFISGFFLCLHYNFVLATLHYFSMWLTSAWVICMSQWHLDCSLGQVGQQMWFTFNSGFDTHFGMGIYEVIKINSCTKIGCCYSEDSQNLEVFWIIVVHYR